jgi:hypothetical protein
VLKLQNKRHSTKNHRESEICVFCEFTQSTMVQYVRKVAVQLQKVLEVMSTSVYVVYRPEPVPYRTVA